MAEIVANFEVGTSGLRMKVVENMALEERHNNPHRVVEPLDHKERNTAPGAATGPGSKVLEDVRIYKMAHTDRQGNT